MKKFKGILTLLLVVLTICVMNISAFAESNSTISFSVSGTLCATEPQKIELPKGNNSNVIIDCNVNNINDKQYWVISIRDYSNRIVSSIKIVDTGIYFIDYGDDTSHAFGTQYYLTISTNCKGGLIYGYLQI